MPIVTVDFLANSGPLLTVAIGLSQPKAAILRITNQPVPQKQIVQALIDTGASGTVIDQGLVPLLGLVQIGTLLMHSASATNIVVPTYDVMFAIGGPAKGPAMGLHYVEQNIQVTSAPLAIQNIGALIGRDILSKCLLTYNGPACTVSLAY